MGQRGEFGWGPHPQHPVADIIVWKIHRRIIPFICNFVDSCFIHSNWIIGRAKDGLDGFLIWLIAATLFSLYSALGCLARYFSFMLSGPILWFQPHLNLSDYSRLCQHPWMHRRGTNSIPKHRMVQKLEKTCQSTKLLAFSDWCCSWFNSFVQFSFRGATTVKIPAWQFGLWEILIQDLFPAFPRMYLVTGRFRNCLWRRDAKISFPSSTSLRCLARSLVRKDRHSLLWGHFPDLCFCSYQFG